MKIAKGLDIDAVWDMRQSAVSSGSRCYDARYRGSKPVCRDVVTWAVSWACRPGDVGDNSFCALQAVIRLRPPLTLSSSNYNAL